MIYLILYFTFETITGREKINSLTGKEKKLNIFISKYLGYVICYVH